VKHDPAISGLPEDIMKTARLTIQLIALNQNTEDAAAIRVARLINAEREQWKSAIEDWRDGLNGSEYLHRSTELLLGRIKAAA
jgi:hypothetical protein